MKNYEKLKKLLDKREIELREAESIIINKYKEQIESNPAFIYKFSLDQIEGLGFKKVGFYSAGYEYLYEKNGKKICVGASEHWIRLRGIPKVVSILDMEELEDYANGLIYQDFKFAHT
jgi:hypothetical protein